MYEIVLREGRPEDIVQWVDGAFLIDLWDELVLPREIRSAWAPVIDAVLAAAGDMSTAEATGGAGGDLAE